MEFYRGDFQDGHPTFAEGSQAVTQPVGAPAEISVSKIVYSKDDDDAIDEFHRRTVRTASTGNLKPALIFLVIVCLLVESMAHPVRKPQPYLSYFTHFE